MFWEWSTDDYCLLVLWGVHGLPPLCFLQRTPLRPCTTRWIPLWRLSRRKSNKPWEKCLCKLFSTARTRPRYCCFTFFNKALLFSLRPRLFWNSTKIVSYGVYVCISHIWCFPMFSSCFFWEWESTQKPSSLATIARCTWLRKMHSKYHSLIRDLSQENTYNSQTPSKYLPTSTRYGSPRWLSNETTTTYPWSL